MVLTPNGRFELGKKVSQLDHLLSPSRTLIDTGQICIDGLTSFHAGSWQPAWGIRTGEPFLDYQVT
jgi:ubiquitin-conjugating enzyme E2 J1